MSDFRIKEISSIKDNDKAKTKIIFSDMKNDKEIILEGVGSIKLSVNA